MKHLSQVTAVLFVAVGFAWQSQAAVLLDDTWADGNRTNTSFPTDAAWFFNNPANVAVYTNMLSVTNGTGSSQWFTYFTPGGSPIRLAVNDTLTVSLSFRVNGVGAQNGSRTFRVGLYDSSGGSRGTSDANIPGANYTGYAFFSNFGLTWGTGLQHLKRTTLSTSDPLQTTGDSTTLGTGGTVNATEAFTNGGNYTLTLTYERTNETTLVISAAYTGGGLANVWTVLDTGAVGGGINTNFDTLEIRPSGSATTATNFVLTEFKVTGPTASATAPSVLFEPADLTRVEGTLAQFNVGASGTATLKYQWYFTNTSLSVPNATNATLSLSSVALGQAGGYYCIVTNNQGAATSRVAQLTVNLPIYTGTGVVVDDVWADSDRSTGPVGISNSVWFASTASSLTASLNSMLGTPDAANSRTWVGYFTDDPTLPVDLNVGRAIRVKLVFTPTGVADKNTSSLRLGLFSYADGGVRLNADAFGNWSTNVTGYMLTQNFGTNFGDDTPMEIYARNNLSSGDVLGSTGDYLSLGAGPAGSSNAPAFIDGTEYTLEFMVTRTATSKVDVTTKVTGGSLNISYSQSDTNYAYRRFDGFGIRPNRTIDSAATLNITRFLVEVIEPTLPFVITSAQRLDANSVKLTWDSVAGKTYVVESRNSISPGAWSTNGTVTATSSSTAFTNTGVSAIAQRYYRVGQTP